MVMLVRLRHALKAHSPMLTSLLFFPKVMFFKLKHKEKALFPMLVTLSGIMMLVRLLQL